MAYIGKYADSGSQNTFYKVKNKPYGFKGFPNKSLATFAHAVQGHLAPMLAPKVFSPVCRIRIPNYFAESDGHGGIRSREKMVLSDWGYLTEIARPYSCRSTSCDECYSCEWCPNYEKIHDLLVAMEHCGIEYRDAHPYNLGYVKRKNKRVLVAIDFGAESCEPMLCDDKRFPDICWDGAEDMSCGCDVCVKKYSQYN
jgi:hypothetical protein